MIKTKRIYDPVADTDGYRVLVDRLWPRGLKKETAHIDLWEKEIAPTNELRKWFGHAPEKFEEFARRYQEELQANPRFADFETMIRQESEQGDVTLLYSAHDEAHNNAVVLLNILSI
ncbi:hypothetical protein HMPREF3034_01540 [Prevotella sp. DNF00663]|nr:MULTISPECIES: DUF488 domain-containing protein [unclassified Prevotella]KGI60794.1 uroporphyrin-III methyltransferase [Prevotella sp. S7 MS 2]KXB82585.1 hypothetical protein HMPREF3034_01540 [Prevotella sp. DNF00663]